MTTEKKYIFLFPGQGAQYTGMGKDFAEQFPLARQTFEEADELLQKKISKIIFEGPTSTLTETQNSQVAIFITSVAILRVIESNFPHLTPSICAGLSLGEYTALYASGRVSFEECLKVVQYRGQFMNDACESTKGSMAVILGLDATIVQDLVREVNLPYDLWAANFNCPQQIVISGTQKGIEAGTKAALAKGAKRVLPLQVHGAFHSGLMQNAENRLTPYIYDLKLKETSTELVMNVSAEKEVTLEKIRQNLIKQVTSPVLWEQSIRYIDQKNINLYLEIGPGKTLAGFNKRIGVLAPTISIENIKELSQLS